MKSREHLWIHDKLMGFVMIATFCLTFFVVISLIQIENKQRVAAEQMEKEHYANNCIFQYQVIEGEEVNSKLQFKKLNITQGNVIIIYNTVVGNSYSIAPIHMVISSNEPLVEELAKGRFPKKSEISHGRKCVVVGEGLLRLAEKKGKKSEIMIDSVPYEIIGVLKDITGDGTDNRIIVFSDCLDERSILGLNGEYYFGIEYGSNQGEIEQLEELQEWLFQFASPEHFAVVEEKEMQKFNDMRTLEQMLAQYKKFVFYGLFGFCMIACLVVSSTWTKRRHTEMVIRKAFGSSFGRIVVVVLRDLSIMMGISLLINGVYLMAQSIIVGKLWMNQVDLLHDLLYFIVASLIVLGVTLIRPLYMITKISPAEGIKQLC